MKIGRFNIPPFFPKCFDIPLPFFHSLNAALFSFNTANNFPTGFSKKKAERKCLSCRQKTPV
ncbi:MAG: hypothetical protein ACOX6U_00390 [Oscillospiraceae bacterium]